MQHTGCVDTWAHLGMKPTSEVIAGRFLKRRVLYGQGQLLQDLRFSFECPCSTCRDRCHGSA